MTTQTFIVLGLSVFVFCVVIAIYHLCQKIQHRREQILKEIEAAARKLKPAIKKNYR